MADLHNLPAPPCDIRDTSFERGFILMRCGNSTFHLSAPAQLRDADGQLLAEWIPDQADSAEAARKMVLLIPRALTEATVRHDGTLTLTFAAGQTLAVPPEPGSPYESWYALGVDASGSPWEVVCESGNTAGVFIVAEGVDLDLPGHA